MPYQPIGRAPAAISAHGWRGRPRWCACSWRFGHPAAPTPVRSGQVTYQGRALDRATGWHGHLASAGTPDRSQGWKTGRPPPAKQQIPSDPAVPRGPAGSAQPQRGAADSPDPLGRLLALGRPWTVLEAAATVRFLLAVGCKFQAQMERLARLVENDLFG